VALVAAVPMPDDVFGEKVACYIVLQPGQQLSLEDLREHLDRRGLSIESWPERLIFLDALPMSSGAKVAKGQLRLDMKQRMAAEGVTGR